MIHAYSAHGYAQRMWCYLQEMYPLAQRLPLALIIGAAVVLFTQSALAEPHPALLLPLAVSSAAVFLLLLLLRLMDELKDVEIDRALFRERPLPSGRVRESDIRISMTAVAAAFVALHLLLPVTLLSAIPLLGYTFLMYRYFFVPGLLRGNLFLNLATHNPVIPLIVLHCMIVTAAAADLPLAALDWNMLLRGALMLWMPMFAWEIARKIRAPEDENAYVTYSRLLGRHGAVALAFAAQSVAAASALSFVVAGSWSAIALLPLLAAWILLTIAYARFLLRPVPAHARLRVYGEVYAVTLMISVIFASWSAS